jgi:hypothetical protein
VDPTSATSTTATRAAVSTVAYPDLILTRGAELNLVELPGRRSPGGRELHDRGCHPKSMTGWATQLAVFEPCSHRSASNMQYGLPIAFDRDSVCPPEMAKLSQASLGRELPGVPVDPQECRLAAST